MKVIEVIELSSGTDEPAPSQPAPSQPASTRGSCPVLARRYLLTYDYP